MLLFVPLEGIEDSIDRNGWDCEEIDFFSITIWYNRFSSGFFLADDLPNKSSFNEQFREEIKKWKDERFIEWTKEQR